MVKPLALEGRGVGERVMVNRHRCYPLPGLLPLRKRGLNAETCLKGRVAKSQRYAQKLKHKKDEGGRMKDEVGETRNLASPVPDLPQLGAVLAFDFGEKRIGVAVGDLKVKIAHPLTTITSEVNDKRFAAIGELVSEYRPALLVVGLPSHADGGEHVVARLARKFAQRLTGRFGVRVVLVDESYSSASASEALTESGVRGARQKLWLDQVAAQQILQQFLDDPKIIP